jgi:chorismate mutase
MNFIRGIRGAISVSKNTKGEIISSTRTLLVKMTGLNKIKVGDIASIIFSATKDLDAEFPAIAARKLGWKNVPLLCTYEVDVPGSLPRCIRVLMHVNSKKSQSAVKHIYLNDAKKLRPDLG